MLAYNPLPTPADFVKKWTLRFADNSFQFIRENTFREFAADIAGTFGVSVDTVPAYQPGAPYQAGFLVRYAPAPDPEAFYYSLKAGVLAAPGPGNPTEWQVVPGPVAATALSQEITLVQAQGIEGRLVVAGRTYLVDVGPEPGTGYPRTISLRGISNRSFDTEGTLEVNGLRTPVQHVDVLAGTWQVKGAGSGSSPAVTAQLLGLDPSTGELLILLSPTAPASLAAYVLATYTAGTTPPPPGSGNNYVAAGYVTSGYVS